MKKGRFTEDQIIGLLKQQVGGRTTAEVGREEGISAATFYQWKAKFGGMSVCDAQRLRQLEAENAKLHRVVANQGIDVVALQDVLSKNGDAERSASAPAAKREVAGYLQEHHGRSQRKASALIDTSPSVLRRQRETGGAVSQKLCVLAQERPRLGHRRLHFLPQREGVVQNRKRTYRLDNAAHPHLRPKKKRKLAARSRGEVAPLTGPNQL